MVLWGFQMWHKTKYHTSNVEEHAVEQQLKLLGQTSTLELFASLLDIQCKTVNKNNPSVDRTKLMFVFLTIRHRESYASGVIQH